MVALLVSLKRYWISSTLFIITIIMVLSLWPLDTLPSVPGSDKTHHFIAYGALMFPTALKKPKHWLFFGLLFMGCSGLIELVQPYVNRYGEVKDFSANIGGLVCGFILAQVMNRLFPAPQT